MPLDQAQVKGHQLYSLHLVQVKGKLHRSKTHLRSEFSSQVLRKGVNSSSKMLNQEITITILLRTREDPRRVEINNRFTKLEIRPSCIIAKTKNN